MNDANAGQPDTKGSLPVILALGTTQTIAWASSYYLPAILAAPIARDLGLSPTFVFGALSGALIIAGLLGPRVGAFIDTFGGRGLLAISNLVFAAGLALLSIAGGFISLAAAWLILGVGMGMGLYEAAFATLTRIYGTAARRPITGITLIAGFASTVGWPASTWLDAEYGWRIACQVWALVHVAAALPLNLLLPRAQPLTEAKAESPEAAHGGRSEAGWLSRYHPLVSSRLATLSNPIGVCLMAAGGPVLGPVFAVFYGAGNGILTIARGTLPLALFGPHGFGRRVGVLSLPARATGALAPLAVGFMIAQIGTATLWVCAAISLSAFAALLMLHTKPAR